ncbi:uncharacterized protein EV154DRAFT_482077 [Mucor mucedo]|uniref:uncharacterized protein n=1 Tax=Mucor mucedo TaxID=29922 RepID=UPI00221FE0B4|nr:uncharacterized protein EV154DRAFT_482077 [Mucor mucedo]KAI7890485.1 hypothetical protein EV154DRAFT_482077 [Mucor mucedo]
MPNFLLNVVLLFTGDKLDKSWKVMESHGQSRKSHRKMSYTKILAFEKYKSRPIFTPFSFFSSFLLFILGLGLLGCSHLWGYTLRSPVRVDSGLLGVSSGIFSGSLLAQAGDF